MPNNSFNLDLYIIKYSMEYHIGFPCANKYMLFYSSSARTKSEALSNFFNIPIERLSDQKMFTTTDKCIIIEKYSNYAEICKKYPEYRI